MDNSLQALTDAIKKILTQLKPQVNQLSFVIVTGKSEQGKSALLKQSAMEEMPVFSEQHAKIYFNQKGIFVELGESWFTNSKTLLQNTFKQLNKCNRFLRITGLILCIDVNELLTAEPAQGTEKKKAHLRLLHRLGSNLNYPIELALMLTKMDTLAGFSEFYQTDHISDLAKPLGFSLESENQLNKKIQAYSQQFNQLIEQLGQQVINKMHPARSTIRRSLIREFPLQLASLRVPIQTLLQGISPKFFHLHSIYFTSAEQGGVSIDRLNKKIQHEYALVVQDTFPQAVNFRAYFIEGALKTFQDQASQLPIPQKYSQKALSSMAAGLAGIGLILLAYNHYKTVQLLDEASKELLVYDNLSHQDTNNSQALYHLSNAANKIAGITTNSLSLPTVQQLKLNLHYNAENRIQSEFVPSLIKELEQAITNPGNTPIARYKALKIYIMFAEPKHRVSKEIYSWFKIQWETHPTANTLRQLSFLQEILQKPLKNIEIKQTVINDARNYLNALPNNYLYYLIAKEFFPRDTQTISVQGFNLARNELPIYYTKEGFNSILKDLSNISTYVQAENWVLAHEQVAQLHPMLIEAYCFDYATWWQTFMKKSQPVSYQDLQQGRQVIQLLQQTEAINKLTALVQHETSPDLSDTLSIFNQSVATKFTDLNLISQSSIKELSIKIGDLEHFISTLSVVQDHGKTAFTISRSRFINQNSSDPVSILYTQAQQLPEPLSSWTKQIAGDTWSILIKESRLYINQQWESMVFKEFQNKIALRYPFDSAQSEEITITDFNRFFATHGILNNFTEQYIKPFLDVSTAQWKPKAVNDYILPISSDALDEIIRANIITNMFFPDRGEASKIQFSLQKISLDPVVASLNLEVGETKLTDTQGSDSFIQFSWPQENAKLSLNSIEGNHYELAEEGTWALFKLLEKVNVLVDEQDSSSLQILFEVNSNSGRYLLKTNNQINPFTPGILNGFVLNKTIV